MLTDSTLICLFHSVLNDNKPGVSGRCFARLKVSRWCVGEQITNLCLGNSKSTWVQLLALCSCAHLLKTSASGRDTSETRGRGRVLLCAEAQVTSFLDEWPCMPRQLAVCLKGLEPLLCCHVAGTATIDSTRRFPC